MNNDKLKKAYLKKWFVGLFQLAFLLLILPNITGCWDRTEIEDLGIAGIMGIDKVTIQGREQFLVMLQVIKLVQAAGTSGGNSGVGGQASAILYKGTGLTLADALANIQISTPHRLFLADLGAIIVGEKVARDGINQIIDFLGREREIRLLRGLFVAKESVEKLLSAQPQLSLSLGQEIKDTIEINRGLSSKLYSPTIKDFINDLISPSASSVTGCLKTAAQTELSPEKPTPAGGKKTTFSFAGLAVFVGDKKVGELTKTETAGYLLLTGKGKGGIIPVRGMIFSQAVSSYRIESIRVKTVPFFEDDVPGFRIELRVEGDVREFAHLPGKLDNKSVAVLEKELAVRVKNLTEATLRKTQKQGADVFGLAKIIYAKNPELWAKLQKDWPQIYRELPIEVIPEVKIRKTGFIIDSIKFPGREYGRFGGM